MIELKKTGSLVLSKSSDNLAEIKVGLEWKPNAEKAAKKGAVAHFDLDVFGILVNNDNTGLNEKEVVYYGNVNGAGISSDAAYTSNNDANLAKAKEMLKSSPIVLTKDERTGETTGFDEVLFLNPTLLPKNKKIIIVISIYEGELNKQTFGMIDDCACTVLINGNKECKYNLKEDFELETGVVIGEFYWYEDNLKIRALGTAFNGDINDLIAKYK